jgi:hypothetical protein
MQNAATIAMLRTRIMSWLRGRAQAYSSRRCAVRRLSEI